MRDTGVRREIVLRALRSAGPPHSPKKLTIVEQDGWWVTVSDNERWTLREFLPPDVCKATVNHLCKRFMVPRIWFYETLSAPGDEEKGKPC
jgi:hypothetical protein